MEEAMATVHLFKAEPLFSQTGTGSLRPASPEERLIEIERIEQFVQRIRQRAQQAEQGDTDEK